MAVSVDAKDARHAGAVSAGPPLRFALATAATQLPAEEPLAIELNGQRVAVLMRTPGQEKALALGYCLSEGLVRSVRDVAVIHHCGSGLDDQLLPLMPGAGGPLPAAGNRVRLLLAPVAEEPPAQTQVTRWVFSSCGGVDVETLGQEIAVNREGPRMPREALLQMVPAVVSAQEAYRASGGIHAAALFDHEGRLLALAEDVGRHNAVDKVIGLAALGGQLPGAVLICTGRASSDVVMKAGRVGIPVVASFSSSTSLGVRLAEKAGMTLIGYLRRKRFSLYTHPERIV